MSVSLEIVLFLFLLKVERLTAKVSGVHALALALQQRRSYQVAFDVNPPETHPRSNLNIRITFRKMPDDTKKKWRICCQVNSMKSYHGLSIRYK